MKRLLFAIFAMGMLAIGSPAYAALACPTTTSVGGGSNGYQALAQAALEKACADLDALVAAGGGGSGGGNVNLTQVNSATVATGHGTAATALRVELPTDGTGTVGINAGTAVIGKVGIDQTTPGTTNGVQVNAALPAGTALIGKVGIDQTTPGTTNKVSIGTDGTVAIGTALPAGSAILGKVGIDQTTPGTTNLVSIGSGGSVTPLASENHIGEVGNNQITITVAQTVTASSAYATGNAVGGLLTFTGAARVSGAAGAAGTSGLIQSAMVNSKSLQTTQMDLVLFNSNPTTTTCTDKVAIAVSAADFDKVIGAAIVSVWTALGTPSVGQATNLAMPYALTSNTTLYGCLVTRSTPTFTATTDISVSLRVIRN